MSLDVMTVENGKDLRDFVGFPYGLHRSDPLWVPPLRRDVYTLLSPRKNPFFDHATAQHFLARRDGRVVGRVSAIENRRHNEVHQDKVGFFGFFECIDDEGTAARLFDAAAGWLRGQGLSAMRGPASPSMNDEAGLLIDGFETPPCIMMPHNPRYYVRLLEAAGFAKAKDLLVFENRRRHFPERLIEGTQLIERRYGLTTRTLDMKAFDREVALIKELYNKAWEKNWGFVPMTDREMDHLATQLKPVIVPETAIFAMHKDEPIGVAVGIPDLNVALKKNPSGRMFPGILKVLWAARKINRLRVLILGSIPEWRGKGVDALLFRRMWEEGNKKGYYWGEGGWVLENNAAISNGLTRLGFAVYKTYRMYDRPL